MTNQMSKENIYNALMDIKKSVGSLHSNLKDVRSHVNEVKEHLDELNGKVADHENKFQNMDMNDSLLNTDLLKKGKIILPIIIVLSYLGLRFLEIKIGLEKIVEQFIN